MNGGGECADSGRYSSLIGQPRDEMVRVVFVSGHRLVRPAEKQSPDSARSGQPTAFERNQTKRSHLPIIIINAKRPRRVERQHDVL